MDCLDQQASRVPIVPHARSGRLQERLGRSGSISRSPVEVDVAVVGHGALAFHTNSSTSK